MKKRRLYLLLILFTFGLSIPQTTYAIQKETTVSIQFAQSNEQQQPIVPPKDQLPSTGDTIFPSSTNETARKLLPQTGEILSFAGQLLGLYLVGFFLMVLTVRFKMKEEEYE